MLKVIYNTATSFTGYIADPAGSLSWLFEVPLDGAPDHGEFMQGVGVLVSGSTTYEWVLREENLLREPAKWQAFYGDRPTFVFTTRSLPRPEGADVRFAAGKVTDHSRRSPRPPGSGQSGSPAAVTWPGSSTMPVCWTRSG